LDEACHSNLPLYDLTVEEGRQDLSQVQGRTCTCWQAILEKRVISQRQVLLQLSLTLFDFEVGNMEAGQE
jgi:hypothetical protein